MKLELLNDETIQETEGKTVYCFGLSYVHLGELIWKYELLDSIQYVIDNNPKVCGKAVIGDKVIEVTEPGSLSDFDERTSVLIITSGYWKEIYAQLCTMEPLKQKVHTVYRFMTRQEQTEEYYLKLYQNDGLEDLILFRSGPGEYVEGTDFYDNARALYEYMIKESFNQKYKLVWLVKNPLLFQKETEKYNVEFISYDWVGEENKEKQEKYFWTLYHARYLFTTDAFGFMKSVRKGQTRIQLWHGCGFKTRVNFSRCEKRYEYMTVISELYAGIHADIYGLRKDQLLITGYPKQDWLFMPYKQGLAEVLHIKRTKKCIFWLPTFRMANGQLSHLKQCQYEINPDTGLPVFEKQKQLEELNQLLMEKDVMLIIKLHFLQKEGTVKKRQYSNICILEHRDLSEKDLMLNRLLAEADALISDYSSAAVDYLLLNHPMAFTVDDLEEYKDRRGFVFEDLEKWLPGQEIRNADEFGEFICEVAEGEDRTREKREKLRSVMYKYLDDSSCKRVTEALHIEK